MLRHRLPARIVPAPPTLLTGLVTVLLLAGACRDQPAQPVAEVAVSPGRVTLPYPGTEEVEITVRPRLPLGEVAGRPRVFLHLFDAEGELVRTFDHELPGDWEVGVEQRYPARLFQSALGPPLPAGEYRLTLGLYDTEGRRWALATAGDEVAKQEYQVAQVEVPAVDRRLQPIFAFPGEWLELEAGEDRQVLGRRWLAGEGAVAVQSAPQPGRLLLGLQIPAPAGEDRFEAAGGGTEPAVTVTSTCDGSEHHLTGFSGYELEVQVGARVPCEVRLAPEFRIVDPRTGRSRALLLEQLHWDGAASAAGEDR
ncbi:MAG TPA: hypothetical protein VHQ65_15175 [Thermoanaerobaculia bacterium]|nr:hypothetical protein [Thermoanaerobaculia bacterium]